MPNLSPTLRHILRTQYRGVILAGMLAAGLSGCTPTTEYALWQPAAPEQPTEPNEPGTEPKAPVERIAEVTGPMQQEAVRVAVARLLEMEEGPDRGEWPYEGVYRVGRRIPIGYRVGGTAIVCETLIHTRGWDEDPARREAVERGIRFVLASREHPLMNPVYDGGYDVRGWGYTTALSMLTLAAESGKFEAEQTQSMRDGAAWYLKAIEQTEIPQAGGWNYARRPGIETVSPPSSFMTAMTVLAIMDAKDAGLEVDQGVLDRAVVFLESSRADTGEYVYSGTAQQRRAGGVPGATGRMLVSEVALQRVGKGDMDRLRASLAAFVEHWDELEKRRAKPGTHQPPYGVAPYYFYFAHRYAAEAVELLPEEERAAERAKVLGLLWLTRDAEDGTWNDRVFPRSASYGTAMSVLAILAPERAHAE
ncbi:MAG: hypothetical protein ACIAQF_10485 [Phycisphaerales bacterium JB065]